MAVGAFWVLMGVSLALSSRNGSAQIERFTLITLVIIMAIMLLSLLVSLTHLGTPSIAYQAALNFGSSWLSREILFAVLFTMTTGVLTILSWREVGSAALRSTLAGVSVIFGVLLILSMSKLYMLRTVRVWNTLYTPVLFYVTALLLGGLLVGAVSTLNLTAGFDINTLPAITTGALSLLVVELILVPVRVRSLLTGSNEQRELLQRLSEGHKLVFIFRWLMGVLGSACLVVMIVQSRFEPGLYALCFALVLTSELSDRFLFYTAGDLSGI
jgi:anaerobic dimethyl sulfoxide reductase subunit C (anchor subunit)